MEELDTISKIINIIRNYEIKYPFWVEGLNRSVHNVYNIVIKDNKVVFHDLYRDNNYLCNFSKLFQKNLLKELKNNIINEHIWDD